MADVRSLTRHHTYYIPSADLSFLLGHVQFRVHRYFFERESPFFKGKLTTPMSPGAVRRGSSDADPLVLEDVRAEDFERFLWVFYNPRYSLYDAKVDDWSVILTLAHRWGFAEVKALAVRELEKKEFSNIDRIVYYQSNDVDRNLLIPHYAAVCARENPLTLAEGIKLGMETTLVIASAREYIRAIPTRNGLRSPVTPTVEGEELYDMIRELFNIPAVGKLEGSPTKDDKPSSSSGGLPTKPQPTTSHPPPTQAAPFSPPPPPLQQKKPPVREVPPTPTPPPKKAQAPEVPALQMTSLPSLTVPSKTPEPPVKEEAKPEEAKPTKSAPPPISTETAPLPAEAPRMEPPQTPSTPTKSSAAAARKAARRERLRAKKEQKETEATEDKPTGVPSPLPQATQESDPKGIDEPDQKVEPQVGKEEEQVEAGGEKVEAVASEEKQDEAAGGVDGGDEKQKTEDEVKVEEAKEAGLSSPPEPEAGDGETEDTKKEPEVEEPKPEKAEEELQAESKTENPEESSVAEEEPKMEKLPDDPTQEETAKETEAETPANESKRDETLEEPVNDANVEEPTVEKKAEETAVETKADPAIEAVDQPVETNSGELPTETKSEEGVAGTKAEEPVAALKVEDPLSAEKQESAGVQIDGPVSKAKVEDTATEVASAEPQPEEAANADKGSESSATEQVKPNDVEALTIQTASALSDVKVNDAEGTDSPVVGSDPKSDDKKARKKDKAARKKAKKLAEEKAAALAAQETTAEGAKPSEEPAAEATPNAPAGKPVKLEPLKTQDLSKTEPLIDISATPSSTVQPAPPLPPKNNASSTPATRGARVPLNERLSKPTPSAWPPTPSSTNNGPWASSSPSSAKPKKEDNALGKLVSSLWG